MSKPANWQYGAIHAALTKLKWDTEIKEGLVFNYTLDESKLSLKDLTFQQAGNLITWLNEQVGLQQPDDAKACNSIRRRIIAIACQLGWFIYDKEGNLVMKMGSEGMLVKQVDYARIDAYCSGHTAAKKPMNKQNKEELQATAVQFNQYHLTTLKAKSNGKKDSSN
jgi:hypothetical protein